MENTQEVSVKINFFKKIWYSIFKVDNYEEMKQEGVSKAIKYFFTLILFIAIILAVIATILQISVVNKTISYLDKYLPEIKFKDNKLSIEDEEAVILDEDEFKEYFNNVIVINPFLNKNQAIEEYKNLVTEKSNVVVFLSDQYIIITSNYNLENEAGKGIESYNYTDISSKYIKDPSVEYTKQHILEYLRERTSYAYYFAEFFVVYYVSILILYVFYILLISVSLWLVTKISKIKWTFKNSLMNTIYSSTFSILIYLLYLIIGYFANFKINFIDIITISLIFVYLFIILIKDKRHVLRKD